MPKKDLVRRIDQHGTPGQAGLSVLTVNTLNVSGSINGDFQVTGRLILGDDPDLGNRAIMSRLGIFGYNSAGFNTVSVYFDDWADQGGTVHQAGDLHLGIIGQTWLEYDQDKERLAIFTPAGAGFMADGDGTLRAGLASGAHMRWRSDTQSLTIQVGETIMADIGADGNAWFAGEIRASGGYIDGQMDVTGYLRAGHVDGPSIQMGRFVDEADNEYSALFAFDDNNLPWMTVRAGGATPGYFHLGGTGDYDDQFHYDGNTVVVTGTITGSTIVAAQGEILLDESGFRIHVSTISPLIDFNSIQFIDPADDDRAVVWISGYQTPDQTASDYEYMLVKVDARTSGRRGLMSIQAFGDTDRDSYIALLALADDEATTASVQLDATAAGVAKLTFIGDTYLDMSNEMIDNINHMILDVLTAEPASPENGMIAYADGTSWDPGKGAGFYGYAGGAWDKIL